jgi:hypothetical protein
MKYIYSTFILAATLTIVSCGRNERKRPPRPSSYQEAKEVKVKPPMKVTWEELEDGKFEDGQIVIFKSFVAPLPSTMYFSGDEIALDFHPRRHQTNGWHLRVDVPLGSGKNQIEHIDAKYVPTEDIHINTEDGDVAEVGDYVLITGVWSEASDDKYDYLDLTGIEILEYTSDNASFESAQELKDEVIDSEGEEAVYCYMEGSMELSMFMSSYDGVSYTLDFSQSNNQYVTKVGLMIGSEASTMNELESGFLEKDFIVRDSEGAESAATGKKFRLYGTFKKSDYDKKQKGAFDIEEIVKL